MQKRGLLIAFILGIFLINFVSAADFFVSDFFENFDTETMILAIVFLISFAVLNFALAHL